MIGGKPSGRIWRSASLSDRLSTTTSRHEFRIRRGEDLVAWLQEHRAAGIVGFHASLAGCRDTHDRWNGRAGDFEYQIEILRPGGGCGMVREEKLFLTKDTLPLFDRLLGLLHAIPGELHSRTASPFFCAGLATRYENERLTERPSERPYFRRRHLSTSWTQIASTGPN